MRLVSRSAVHSREARAWATRRPRSHRGRNPLTHLFGLLASYHDIPLVIGDATSLTESGYVGDDVESFLSAAPGEARRLPVIAPLDALGADDPARRWVEGVGVEAGFVEPGLWRGPPPCRRV
jgi:hypothetical protein